MIQLNSILSKMVVQEDTYKIWNSLAKFPNNEQPINLYEYIDKFKKLDNYKIYDN